MDRSQPGPQPFFASTIMPWVLLVLGLFDLADWVYRGFHQQSPLFAGIGLCALSAAAFIRVSQPRSAATDRVATTLTLAGALVFLASIALQLF